MKKITNAEYMISMLMDLLYENGIKLHDFDIDDGGSSMETMIYANIECPYHYGEEQAECDSNGPCVSPTREQCTTCKYNWLISEIDD
ncbi:MAG: hypothetical protein ACI4ET_04860 [Bilifractor sp.]